MRLFLIVLLAVPAMAQFRMIELKFRGSDCISCTASLPERLRRMRGVESAEVDVTKGLVTLRLAEANRVRLEQVRDVVEQDGTKALSATVHISGEVTNAAGAWIVTPEGFNARYRVDTAGTQLSPGKWLIRGEVTALRPDGGLITIRALPDKGLLRL